VQLIVLGFSHPRFHGEIIEELERLRESGTVRVIDSLAVYKDAHGELEVEQLSNLSEQEAIELGTKIGALIGLGIEGEEGMEAGAAEGAREAAAEGINVFGGADEWDVLKDIPNDSRQRSSCLSTTGRCRCGTRSRARAASALATGSSARSTSSRSGSCRPRRPRNCTTWRPPPRPGDDDEQ
jgi:uncharacterized membrane protein